MYNTTYPQKLIYSADVQSVYCCILSGDILNNIEKIHIYLREMCSIGIIINS